MTIRGKNPIKGRTLVVLGIAALLSMFASLLVYLATHPRKEASNNDRDSVPTRREMLSLHSPDDTVLFIGRTQQLG